MLVIAGFFVALANANSVKKGLELYESGRTQEAFDIFYALCEKNNSTACFSVAFIIEEVENNDDEASFYYSKSCEGGVAGGCFNLALILERQGGDPKLTFYKACSMGHTKACKELATRYENADDGFTAVELFERACQRKDGTACFELAKLYADGSLTRQSPANALRYYRTACELRHAESCHRLGVHFENLSDNEKAKRYYGKGCDTSYRKSCESYRRILE